jgi:hypothetical protein
MVEAGHRAEDGRDLAGHADAEGDAEPDQQNGFDWLRSRIPDQRHFEVPLRLASSADRPEPRTRWAAAAPVPVPTPNGGSSGLVSASAEAAPAEPKVKPPRPPRQRGLPRRVRQANLAPQLQKAGAPTLVTDVDQAPPTPSPELIRARMSAFQTGTNRGRQAGDTRTGQEDIQ